MRWLTVVVAALALSLAAVGCGGSDESAATTDTATLTESTTEETTTEETTTDDTETSAAGFPSADCLKAVSAFGVLAQAAAAAAGVDANDSLASFQAFADNAPDEIKDDLQVLASGYAAYIKTLSDLDLKQGDVPNADQTAALATASQAFSTSEFQTASDHWNAWLATNCPSG
jgi:hypothetical protein